MSFISPGQNIHRGWNILFGDLVSDPFFANVVLLAPFSGGVKGNAIPTATPTIDLSSYHHPLLSANGSNVAGLYWSGLDNYSGVFDVTRYGQVVAGANSDGSIRFANVSGVPEFAMGLGDFTVECDICTNTGLNINFWGVGSTGNAKSWFLGNGATAGTRARLAFFQTSLSAVPVIVGAADVFLDNYSNWVTCAYSRVAGIGYLFANGVLQGSAADTVDYDSTSGDFGQGPGTGNHQASFNPLKGYIANVRMTKGIGRYTASYTPPTGPYPRQ